MRRSDLLSAAFACAIVSASSFAAAAQELPAGPNRDLVYGNCRTCHDLQYLKESAGLPRDTWTELLDTMKQYGLRIQPDVRAKILDYLATYLGPNPPPASAAAPAATQAAVDGSAVFHEQCVQCHQPDGKGSPGNFPPLAGNRDLFLSRDFPAMVALYGMEGPIAVKGAKLDSVMPPFDHLSDAEIAAVVRYVRSAWGNDKLRPAAFEPIEAGDVTALRKKAMTSVQVHGARAVLGTARR